MRIPGVGIAVAALTLGAAVLVLAQSPGDAPPEGAGASPTETPDADAETEPPAEQPTETPEPRQEWAPLAPEFTLGDYVESDYYPCMDCHEDEGGNPTPRTLEDEHDDLVLNHGPKSRWCLDCHDLDNRNRLKLASGETIEFQDSVRLCGQCHGQWLAAWRMGVHGKVTGNMFGVREFRRCIVCHNPHHPAFGTLVPKPPPHRPVGPGEES